MVFSHSGIGKILFYAISIIHCKLSPHDLRSIFGRLLIPLCLFGVAHHPGMAHTSHQSNHRVTTPSQRVTPRSQSRSSTHEQMMSGGMVGPNTPALLQLSQLAGRQQHLAQHQNIAG